MGEVIEKLQSENSISQPAIEHTAPTQPKENNEGVITDTELEKTLKNMKSDTVSFQTYEDSECGWTCNNHPVKILDGTEVEVNKKT